MPVQYQITTAQKFGVSNHTLEQFRMRVKTDRDKFISMPDQDLRIYIDQLVDKQLTNQQLFYVQQNDREDVSQVVDIGDNLFALVVESDYRQKRFNDYTVVTILTKEMIQKNIQSNFWTKTDNLPKPKQETEVEHWLLRFKLPGDTKLSEENLDTRTEVSRRIEALARQNATDISLYQQVPFAIQTVVKVKF